MRSVGIFIRRFARDASGATAIEYSIVVGMIFLAIVSAVQLFTDNTNAMYNHIEASIKSK
jgi:pilus assembly protein Flp/PilA